MWMLMKMTSMPNPEPQRQSMNRVMLWGMTLGFALLALILPSGLGLYWVTSNIVGMVLQFQVTGWGSLKRPLLAFLKTGSAQPASNPRAKRRGTTDSTKKAGQGVSIKQVGAKTGNARSENKEAAKGDASSLGKEIGYKELGDERKD